MAKTWTDRGKLRLTDGTFQTATKNIAAFKGTAPSAGTIAAYNFLSEAVSGFTSGEAAASGYARAAITSTLTENDASTRVDISYSATVSLGSSIATGETWTGIGCFNTSGGSDAARELYWVDVPASSIATPGTGAGVTYTPANDTVT